MMKCSAMLTFLFLTTINLFGQTNYIPKDTIVSRYLKGDMIIINDWALGGPTNYFDSVKISKESCSAILLDKDTAIAKYGYFGNKINIYELTNPSIDSISYGYFIDARILKYLNPEKEIFYFINGAPCHNYTTALEMITNKKIIEVQELEISQATAIWGQKEGKNGALIINTENKPKRIVLYK